MKKTLVSIIALIFSQTSWALCGNSEVVFEVIISPETSHQAFMNGSASLTKKDMVRVFEIATLNTIILKDGKFEDDGSGNYEISATNTDGQSLKASHDHETWETDGIWGQYKDTSGATISLSDIVCSSDDFILVR